MEDRCRLLHPRAAFFITTADSDGKPNVMTCTWATPVSEEPPMLIVCIEKQHHTAELIRRSGEFGISIPSDTMVEQLVLCGTLSGHKDDKFAKAGLKQLPARYIKAPLIDDCIGWLECRVTDTVEAGECYAFVGKILSAAVDERFFQDGVWNAASRIPLHMKGGRMVYFSE
ncbi:MAG: flavin reductase family protein [Nitrospirota bacterium]|nr:flavin reductase family protein [Nitrospirota bacterium]